MARMKDHRTLKELQDDNDRQTTPDWRRSCIVRGAKPVVPATGMCGPCTFGEAETAGGNW